MVESGCIKFKVQATQAPVQPEQQAQAYTGVHKCYQNAYANSKIMSQCRVFRHKQPSTIGSQNAATVILLCQCYWMVHHSLAKGPNCLDLEVIRTLSGLCAASVQPFAFTLAAGAGSATQQAAEHADFPWLQCSQHGACFPFVECDSSSCAPPQAVQSFLPFWLSVPWSVYGTLPLMGWAAHLLELAKMLHLLCCSHVLHVTPWTVSGVNKRSCLWSR